MKIQWEEPPSSAHIVGSGRKPGRYAAFAEALQENEGEWAVLPPMDDKGTERTPASANGLAQNIRRGEVKGFKKGEYETAIQGSKVWVRYIGPQVEVTRRERPRAVPSQPTSADEDDDPGLSAGDLSKITPRVRQWAKDHGHDVPDRGRLPQKYYRMWAEETGAQLPVRAVR